MAAMRATELAWVEIGSRVCRIRSSDRGIATITTSADNDRALEFNMKDELTRYTKDLVTLAAQNIPRPPLQRELEDFLREIIEG
jgi:hypothetical protein